VNLKRWLFVLPLLAMTVACDQTSKRLAAELLEGLGPTPYMGGSVELLYAENSGAFLGLGARLAHTTRFWLFTVGVSALLMLFLYKLHCAASKIELLGWSLIVGGGLGNLIDRLMYDGRVIDFLRVGFGDLRTGIFNLADAAIVAGLIALLVSALYRTAPDVESELS
jgi:signal peptidase II